MQIDPVSFSTNLIVPGEPQVNLRTKTVSKPLPDKSLEKSIESEDLTRLKNALAEHNIQLKFSRDDRTNDVVVKMVDEKTGDEIRQFPTEVSLALAANFIKLQGQFVDDNN